MARPASKSANPRLQRDREAARAQAAEEARRQAYARAVRRRRLIGVGVVAAVILAVIGAVVAANNQKSTKTAAASTTTTSSLPTTDASAKVNPNPPASLPQVTPGAALTGATACPPTDGSAARTTTFAQAPPMCIDPAKDYTAVIHTSAGDLRVALNSQASPNSVNNFVTLARYRYYDGLPFTRVVARGWAEVADPTNADGTTSPGYRVPGEAPAKGSLATPVSLAMIPDAEGTTGGGFIIGLADQSAGMPANATQIGLILDSRLDQSPGGDPDKTVQQVIDRAATASGAPAEVITVTGITIEEAAPR